MILQKQTILAFRVLRCLVKVNYRARVYKLDSWVT